MPFRVRLVRHSLLLSAMKSGHARRATRASAHRLATRRRVWLASITLPIILVAPAIAYVLIPAYDDPQALIEQAGFDPLLPPSRLRGPGALYEVEGRSYRKVCDVSLDMLQGKIRTSPTESQIRERLERGGFSLGGKFLGNLNAKFGGSRVTSIEYRLKDAAISEIPMSDLSVIEDQLLRQKNCDETVQRLLRTHHKVCSGYAVLSATTFYRVNFSSKFESSADARAPIMQAVQHAIEEDTNGQVQFEGTDVLSGENLGYGIQLSSLCVTLDTATEPSVRAQ